MARRRPFGWTSTVVVVALAFVAAACGDDDDQGASATTAGAATTAAAGGGGTATTAGSSGGGAATDVCTADKAGGTLAVAEVGNAQSFDPYITTGGSYATALEMFTFYSSLVRWDYAKNEFVGQLAQSIDSNADASVWTVKLRPGIKFGNGDPMDAAAVKASIDRHLDPNGKSVLRTQAQFVKSVDVVDPLTVQFNLTAPWGQFPLALTSGLGMVQNTKVVAAKGQAFPLDPNGAGAGAYEVKRFTPPTDIVLQAKKDWWGGPVCIQEISFTYTSGAPQTYDTLKTGEIGLGFMFRDPVTIEKAKAEFENTGVIDVGGNIISFNWARPLFADLRARQAVAAAIDPNLINQRAFGGKQLAGSGLIPPESELYDPTQGPKYDPAKAKQLVTDLKAAGLNTAVQLIHASTPPANVEAALTVKSLLDAAGFTVTLKGVGVPELNAARVEGNFDFMVDGILGPEPTLYNSLRRWDSRNPGNLFKSKDAAYDAALDKLKAAVTPEQFQTAVNGMQEAVNNALPFVTYASDRSVAFWTDKLHGLYFTSGVTPYFDKAYLTN